MDGIDIRTLTPEQLALAKASYEIEESPASVKFEDLPRDRAWPYLVRVVLAPSVALRAKELLPEAKAQAKKWADSEFELNVDREVNRRNEALRLDGKPQDTKREDVRKELSAPAAKK